RAKIGRSRVHAPIIAKAVHRDRVPHQRRLRPMTRPASTGCTREPLALATPDLKNWPNIRNHGRVLDCFPNFLLPPIEVSDAGRTTISWGAGDPDAQANWSNRILWN